MISPPLINEPFLAPFPIAATLDTGAPMTNAPGHAITKNVIDKCKSLVIIQTRIDNTKTPGV